MITNPSTENRVFGLDLLRAFAILLVVFGHCAFILNDTFLAGFPFIKMIDGVDLFFVLSGFLIGTILLKEMNVPNEKFDFKKMLYFWKRRWFRTLPSYYLVLILNVIFAYYSFNSSKLNDFSWHFIFFLQNFNSYFIGFFWESWSLTIEEWFYILFPILVFFIQVFSKVKITFLLAALILLIVPIWIRFYNLDFGLDDFWYDVKFRKVVLFRLDAIAYGLLGAWFAHYFEKIWFKLRFVFLGIGIFLMYFLIQDKGVVNSIYRQIWYFSLCPLSVLFCLPFLANFNLKKSYFTSVITFISKISYSMYLINLALLADVFAVKIALQGTPHRVFIYVLYWLILIVASTLLYYFFEKPTTKLREKF